MSWLFPKKKEYKDYYNETYLSAVFTPKENLEKLKKQYFSMKRSSNNNQIMKAKMAGFMAGLEARNKSRFSLLKKSVNIGKERNEQEK